LVDEAEDFQDRDDGHKSRSEIIEMATELGNRMKHATKTLLETIPGVNLVGGPDVEGEALQRAISTGLMVHAIRVQAEQFAFAVSSLLPC
jgi:hypothetical protein